MSHLYVDSGSNVVAGNGGMSPSPPPTFGTTIGSPAWNQHQAQGHPSSMRSPIGSSSVVSPSPSPVSEYGTLSPGAASHGLPGTVPAHSATAANNIMVSIRIRPLSDREYENEDSNIWRTSAANNTIEEELDPIGKRYAFDYISPPEEGTTELYKNLVRKLVLKSCIGYNSNVFAYGQTASGKTFTTLGNEYSPGIVLLAIGDIFHYIAQSPNRQFLLRISCLEIYNEEVRSIGEMGDCAYAHPPSSPHTRMCCAHGVAFDSSYFVVCLCVCVCVCVLDQRSSFYGSILA